MAYLVACLSSGKGTWAQIYKLIERQDWEKIILVTNDFGKEKFNNTKNAELIVVDFNLPMPELKDKIHEGLKTHLGNLGFCDIAVNLTSGAGKEHMAILSSLLAQGIGLRLVDLVGEKVEEV